ncbi:hypothetical protein AVEN_223058-1 [Araneus ventricosus]|uniref:Uncharacterized protein n=1 Tax=Araneus ventricosus TaxID=182803 RepID=A0A4Y2FWT9_ARAVE|nr:hypothetical protein AVEN_223058-1 [Araneus ventricosus]
MWSPQESSVCSLVHRDKVKAQVCGTLGHSWNGTTPPTNYSGLVYVIYGTGSVRQIRGRSPICCRSNVVWVSDFASMNRATPNLPVECTFSSNLTSGKQKTMNCQAHELGTKEAELQIMNRTANTEK